MAMQHPTGEVGVPLSEQEAKKIAEIRDALKTDDGTFGPFTENEAIESLFTYHAPTGDQPARYKRIREYAKTLAYVIDQCCPAGPHRTAAIRHLLECVMTANASIATNNAQYR